jgi:flagellar secretion chaperone FliS
MSNLAAASPQAYRQGAVLAASRGQLVVMLYDGARRFLRQAAAQMREGQIEPCHNTLRRAEMIIAHLDGTLNHDHGEIAEHLHQIYLFSLRHLASARFDRDAGKLEEVAGLLGELREAWAQAAAEDDAR